MGTIGRLPYGSFRKLGVPYFGVLITRILRFMMLYWGPLFSETAHASYLSGFCRRPSSRRAASTLRPRRWEGVGFEGVLGFRGFGV